MLAAEHFKFEKEIKDLKACMESNQEATYINNIDTSAWNEPRMLTLKQVRETFFAMLLQSQMRDQ